MRFRAPATSANLGPGFDAAAVALDLWNELVVEPGDGVEIEGEGADELPRDASHLALRAFALLAPVDGHRFMFVNRIPLERGLGSSAGAIALGLQAGAAVAGSQANLLELGEPLEGHGDNLAAALLGGVTLRWGPGQARRIADDLPFAPIAVIPNARTSTKESRAALPESVPHGDAAETAGAAALLGAAIASGDPELFAAALRDKLHEPYRASPLLEELRRRHLATLSGSGPTVIVWARPDEADAVAAAIDVADARVLRLRVA
ncbi:MAG TPA: homoserine kinase [Gaiellaceae bacterium]|nr:homoserine kinase [Gaiellaceae bacterium]